MSDQGEEGNTQEDEEGKRDTQSKWKKKLRKNSFSDKKAVGI